jgi:multiple sugar transport system permease protein
MASTSTMTRPLAHPRRRRLSPAYAFVLPYALFLLAFGVGPALYAVIISFCDTSTPVLRFNGLANYVLVLTDLRFQPALTNVLSYLAIWLPATLLAVVALALVLHAHMGRFSSTMRMIYYIPSAVTGSAAVLMWLFMLDPLVSPFGFLFNALGMQSLTDTLAPQRQAGVLALIAFFSTVGFWVVVIYGALVNISAELLEAATIDGCNSLQLSWYIKVPLVGRYLVFMLILSLAGGFQIFTEPQIMDAAAAGTFGQTWSLNQLAYNYAITQSNFGAAAAAAMGLLLVGLVACVLIIVKTDFYRIDA